jgi:hypothetical protein
MSTVKTYTINDLSEKFKAGEGLHDEYVRLIDYKQDTEALQAQIDSLMLEYCPKEVTKEQMDNWAKHQRPVTKEESKEIDQAISEALSPI